ncbi:hypothetical protein IJ579_02880 [bacterium]|nr:hypothetical protein [bacterium]
MKAGKIQSYSPKFEAKMIIVDPRVEKYARKAFSRAETYDNYDRFMDIFPSSVVLVRIEDDLAEGIHKMVAKNALTKQKLSVPIRNLEAAESRDEFVFDKLLEKLINVNDKSYNLFWGVK